MVPRSTTDLRQARAQASFDTNVLSNMLCEGGRLDHETKTEVMRVVSEEIDFDKSKRLYMSRGERLSQGLKMTKKLFDVTDREDWGYMEYMEALMALEEPLGLNLHEIAFQPVIQAQGSDEQHEIWMPKCLNHEIIGCYMQTELGHGSNVQQLETTATYDAKTQEFVIESPTISATKWWIGALGLLSTHGVVQARLILNGKDMGPHLFICQLRSLEDHSLLPGIEAGEIGPKVHGSMAAVDNGWARFNKVRIPRDQMLNRFAKVSPEGTYSKPPHDKIAFGGMVFIRAQMIGNLALKLAKAVTISTRYLHCRRQFANPELKRGDPEFGVERQVITYPGVYMRVLPLIAKSYVFVTAGKDMSELYGSMAAQLAQGNTTLLAETHAVSSGLKSYVSASVVEGIEIARRACGGHGAMGGAGIGSIFANELPSVTYEGDNYILVLQVARAALKSLNALRADPLYELSPSSAYLGTLKTASSSVPFKSLSGADWLTPAVQLQVISLRAALAVDRLDRLVRSGRAWSDLSHECIAVSNAVVEAFLVRRMQEALGADNGLLRQGAGDAERKVLSKLINFYILYTIEGALAQLLEFGILAPTPPSLTSKELAVGPIEALRAQVNDLARQLLPELVGLVDAFAFSDWDLNSELGRYDGGAYEALLARAKADLDVNVGDEAARKKMYDDYIKPILERGKRLSHL